MGKKLDVPVEGRGGRLLLWHGEPGAGKTFCIRALMDKWRDKSVSFEYIMDAEAFFGNPSYMMHVAMSNENRYQERDHKLLIVEDAAELLIPEAHEKTGQGLSRLLNMADGILGQGLNIMTLITTNESFSNLHPAVSRPGRCASDIQFGSLSASEAKNWLAIHESVSEL